MAAERIRRAFPDHALLAEEDTRQPADMPSPGDARYCWVIDPLDGTRNYSRGLPCFTISIGLLDSGMPVVAVIRDLITGACWWAVRGQGAHAGDRVIRVSDRPFDRHTLVSFQPAEDGSTYDRAPWVRQVHVRNFGTTALHVALVADGCLDGALCEQNRMWDIAAGALLIMEAGGIITRLDGGEIVPFDLRNKPRSERAFLAGSPQTHSAMLARMTAP
jgi:myo-inositol-1(or 4)-monophosphatase